MDPMKVKSGSVVFYVDSLGKKHFALVTAVWNDSPHYMPNVPIPGVNLVYVSTDENDHDTWGRQIKRDSSVVHQQNQPAHGKYWVEAFPSEETLA